VHIFSSRIKELAKYFGSFRAK